MLQKCPAFNCFNDDVPLVGRRDGLFAVFCQRCGLTAKPEATRGAAVANWNTGRFLTATIRPRGERRRPEMVEQPGNW